MGVVDGSIHWNGQNNFFDFIQFHAERLGMTREEYIAHFGTKNAGINETKKKPGPDPYHRGLDDEEIEDKEAQIKKQAKMDDDDPDAYKEMPGDKEAREKGEVKTSKATKAYNKLYGEDLDEGVMGDLHQMANEIGDEDKFVKAFFKEYGDKIKKSKDSEDWVRSLYRDTVQESLNEISNKNAEKYSQPLKKLKNPKKIRNVAAGRGKYDDMLVWLSHNAKNLDYHLDGQGQLYVNGEDYETVRTELQESLKTRKLQKELSKVETWVRKSELDYDDWDWDGEELTIFTKDGTEKYSKKDLKDEGVFESKVNEMAMGYDSMTGLFYIEGVPFTQERLEQSLKFLRTKVKLGDVPKQFDYYPVLQVADNHGMEMATLDLQDAKKIEGYLKRFKGKLAHDEDFNESNQVSEAQHSGSEASDKMAFSQLERIIDYATMIRDRMAAGKGLDAWMYGKVIKAEDYLNTLYDVIDGDDGVVETQKMTKKDWKKIKGFNKHITKDGEKFVMSYDDRIGTFLEPVEIVDESSLSKVNKHVEKVKKELKKKWAKKGGYENFGQDEIRKLQDEYDYHSMVYGTPEQRKAAKLIDGLDQWAMNYVGESVVTERFNESSFRFGKKKQFSYDDINVAHGFWGTTEMNYDEEQTSVAWEDAFEMLTGYYKFSDDGALYYLNSKAGRHLADKFAGGEFYNMEDAMDDYANDGQWKKWSKEYNKYAQEEMMSEFVESVVTEADDEEQKSTDRSPLDDDKIETALKKKAKDTGVPIGIIRAVMRRGLAAWKSGHRPGANQQQWGYARVNAFLTKGEGTWGKADSDLAKEVRDGGHDKKLKKA